MPAPTNSPDINVTKYTEVASTAIHRIAASRPMSKSRSAFFGAYILEKVYKYCGNGDRQDSVTYRHGFDIICDTCSSEDRTDCKVYHCDASKTDIKSVMQTFLETVRKKQDRERTQKDHNEAQRSESGSVGDQELTELGFTQHPDGAHNHAPSKIFRVKSCMIDQSQSETEQDRDDSGKQDKKSNVGFQSVSAENIYPDICLVSAVNRIDNSGVIGGVGGQFNTELFAGIGSINRAENITAGGVFAHKPCFMRGVAGPEVVPYIKIHILQGRTDGKAGICKIIGKLDGEDHRVTDGNLVGARNGDFLGGSIRFLPGNGTGIDHRGC